jgi:hypothetical protein
MTEKQMEAAINLLPQPGDWEFAAQKMTSLQGMIDPLRMRIPHMPGAESTPSWLEQRQQREIASWVKSEIRSTASTVCGLRTRLSAP